MWSLYLTDSRATALRYNHLRILPPNTVFNQDFSILFLKVHCQSTFMRCLKKASGIKKKKKERERDPNKTKQARTVKRKTGKKKTRQRKQDNFIKGCVRMCTPFMCKHMCVFVHTAAVLKLCGLEAPGGSQSLFRRSVRSKLFS